MANSNNEWGELARFDDEMAEAWDQYSTIPEAGHNLALDAFIESKGISRSALVRLGGRMAEDQVLAFAFPGGIKYRDLLTGRRWSYPGSEFKQLKIVSFGTTPTETVIVTEGESDGAWMSDRAHCDVAILPSGADPRPHTQAYASQLSSYKLVLLGQDNDHAGNTGAQQLLDVLPRAVRYPPPGEAKDWCEAAELPPIPDAPSAAGRILVSAGEIANLEPPPMVSWFERGLLPVAGQMIVHGWAKMGKSFVATDICAALAQGTPWAGFEPTEEPCRVVVMQFEIRWAYLQQRIQALRAAATEPKLFDENFFVWTPMNPPQFVAGNTASEDAVLTTLVDNDIQVFCLDPIRRATGFADMNSEKEVRPILHFFERLQHEGITVLTCHHDNKTYASRGGGDPLGMTGAGAFAGDADTIVSMALPRGLQLESGYRNLHFTTRNAPGIGPRGMQLTDAGVIVYSNSPHGNDETTDTNEGEPAI